jgi:ribosome maturation factor RimP
VSRNISDRVWAAIETPLSDMGFELIETEFVQEGGRWILRVYLDKDGGITLDDCADASQMLSPLLDETDLVEGRYYLEVSSPGIDRPVRRPSDFARFVGEPMKLRAVAPVQGRRRFRGELADFRDGLVVMRCDGNEYAIHLSNVAKASLDR